MRPKVSIAHLARHGGLSLAELPPPFLAPALYSPIISVSPSSKFSTSASFQDRNKNRGVSAIHRSGLKHRLSVSKFKLPVPENPERHEPRVLNPEHGLWDFFLPNKQAFPTPEQEHAHGRSWTVQELRQKSWDDLHCLWWVCVKERNRIATSNYERDRLKAGYGEFEAGERDKTIVVTQNNIKHVLRERWNAWSEARELYNNGYRPEQDELLETAELQEDAMPAEVPVEDIKAEEARTRSQRTVSA
ncbi:Mitochondrial 54S ribosomal protein YmL4 [Trichophyton interdigitale]|uniref:Large ribosomal subunit protein uL29m n=1 Tax=Trichophyton interdigitale TaxID=101480 RepID=A0A9P4YDT8_9EURO|nr:Mitochondrial 54S ribosomal protein YmL4 [Trichophyton interdigitale]KAF3892730.1 Mitochondrial 54S ribosomal protein YmL4 [Trichophyton interdigitale]KAG8207813.1 Mitochondrial 54S ribosomal protein YmL4 [Trichophyton interdigitale]